MSLFAAFGNRHFIGLPSPTRVIKSCVWRILARCVWVPMLIGEFIIEAIDIFYSNVLSPGTSSQCIHAFIGDKVAKLLYIHSFDSRVWTNDTCVFVFRAPVQLCAFIEFLSAHGHTESRTLRLAIIVHSPPWQEFEELLSSRMAILGSFVLWQCPVSVFSRIAIELVKSWSL